MLYHWLADGLVIFHSAFVIFVVIGGFLALRWHWIAWLHVPFAIWAVLLEYNGWICPLTPLENALRGRAGMAGYSGGFIEHYVLRVLYPAGLTNSLQWALGTFALVVNIVAYTLLVRGLRAVELPHSPKR